MPLRLRFTFVRHGQTDDNRNGILVGHLNTGLNKHGRRQAAAVALAPALKETPFMYAFGSDLSRAVDTAEAILRYHGVELVTSQRLREKHFGDAEGKPFGTRVKNRGESFGEFRKRCIGWWKERVSVLIAEHNSSSSDNDDGEDQVVHVLVVSHGGFIRVLFQALLSDPEFRFGGDAPGDLPNTGVSIVEALGVYDGRVLVYADHSHLKVDDQEEEEEGVKTENGGM